MGNKFSSGKRSVSSNDDSYNDFNRKIDKLRDSCIDQLKEFFEKLIPLTHLIAKLICHAVLCLENYFQKIGLFIKVMYFMSRRDLMRTPGIIIQLINNFRTDAYAIGTKIGQHVALTKKYIYEASLKLEGDHWHVLNEGVSSFVTLLENLTEWVSPDENSMGTNALKLILNWGAYEMQQLQDGDTDCQSVSDLCKVATKMYMEKTVKCLVTIVGEFKKNIQKSIGQYSLPIGRTEILLLSV